jgi:hypothetical protein
MVSLATYLSGNGAGHIQENGANNYETITDFTLADDLVIASGETLTLVTSDIMTIASGRRLTIDSGGTLTSPAGAVENDGTITCSGTTIHNRSNKGAKSK